MTSLADTIALQPIVIDNGSGIIKSGFAGAELPSHTFPSLVGHIKHERVMTGGLDQDVYVGNQAEEYRGLLILKYPIEHGIVTDWEGMELLWNHVYAGLKATSDEHPVLLTEVPLNPRSNRAKTTEMFFEMFGCPSLFVSTQAVLALYATGRTTGIVLDIGDGVAHVVPVFEGFALTNAIGRSDVAGRSITHFLSLLLRRAGYLFHTSAEFQVVRQIKESSCYLLFEPQPEDPKLEAKRLSYFKTASPSLASAAETTYSLPDGTPINLTQERYLAPEILFTPYLVGSEYAGVHTMLASAIAKADLDLRKTLYTQIVLSGGSTFFSGFGERLLNEIRKSAPKDTTIRISAPAERKTLTWAGGSILASLSAFRKMWITKQDYEEHGAEVANLKTL